MSNNGLNLENMDLSHIHLAVLLLFALENHENRSKPIAYAFYFSCMHAWPSFLPLTLGSLKAD